MPSKNLLKHYMPPVTMCNVVTLFGSNFIRLLEIGFCCIYLLWTTMNEKRNIESNIFFISIRPIQMHAFFFFLYIENLNKSKFLVVNDDNNGRSNRINLMDASIQNKTNQRNNYLIRKTFINLLTGIIVMLNCFVNAFFSLFWLKSFVVFFVPIFLFCLIFVK